MVHQLKFMSLNLHCGMEAAYDEKINTIALACNELAPDIIVFQECVQHKDAAVVDKIHNVVIKQDNIAYRIMKILEDRYQRSYNFYFDWGKYGFEVFEEGLCILTKAEILETEARYVSSIQNIHNWKTRQIIRVKLKLKGQILYVYNVHLAWWDDGEELFKDQFDALDDWVSKEPYAHHVLVGDFNSPQGGLSYQHMISLGYRDLYFEVNEEGFHDGTFMEDATHIPIEKGHTGQRLDYVMSPSASIRALFIERIFDNTTYGVVSDHLGLLGVLEVEEWS